jgi:TRAP-type C4-dicarboxylate transport system substrate-binding protein
MDEKIPAGFSQETWDKLTPEQKKVYLDAQGGGNQQASNQQTGKQQEDMMKNIQKMTIFSTIFSMISSFLPSIFRRFKD